MGVGKNWAKGLTAASDSRVAHNAASHTGMQYRPRARSFLPLEWTSELAYAVGLMATDGCLVDDGRHLSFTSCDRELVETVLQIFNRRGCYREARTAAGNPVFRAQFGNARLYRWLMSIGLTPRKSLTLGGIDVPDPHFLPLVRGLLDGDGSIYRRVQRPTRKTYPFYEYDRLLVYFTSASRSHVDWLDRRLRTVLGICGYVEWRKATTARRDFFRLRFGKRDSVRLLAELYADPSAPRLHRKFSIWVDYSRRHTDTSKQAKDRIPSSRTIDNQHAMGESNTAAETEPDCADGGTRTRTRLREPPPEDGASTSWATSALAKFYRPDRRVARTCPGQYPTAVVGFVCGTPALSIPSSWSMDIALGRAKCDEKNVSSRTSTT